MSLPQRIALALPVWAATEIDAEAICPSDEAKLELALRPAGRNAEAGNAQPCCQCHGASLWTGVDRPLFAAGTVDVEALAAFGEAPLPVDRKAQPAPRGIVLRQELLRDAAWTPPPAYGHRGSRY